MKRLLRVSALSLLMLWTLAVHQYHMGTIPPPAIPNGDHGEGQWISRTQAGLNHMILKGTSYSRGLKAGELTRALLDEGEHSLISQLQTWIPNPAILQIGVLGLITYFKGGERYFTQNELLEMYGTSKSAPERYAFLADNFTRQIAYHGLHEVGQMLVDRGTDFGCTVAAVPHDPGWILGRNFDFEGGRVFDREKILKWVFPEEGFAHLSVIWAGMVGAVTGVNEKGLYISMNAAGSSDFRRQGTPSTLVLYKALREAADTDQAVRILKDAQMFITDIFVVLDAKGHLVRVEKSPKKTEVIDAGTPFVVTNHLVGKSFAGDDTNEFRKKELTTLTRERRAQELLQKIPAKASGAQKTLKMLEVLRDKGRDESSQPLHPGHHMAIDGLIATHSVIFDSTRGIFYVSKGPSLAGEFIGYDLAQSFERQQPVETGRLPRDPDISTVFYEEFKDAVQTISMAGHLVKKSKCAEALKRLESIREVARNQGPYYHTLGNTLACLKRGDEAREAWRKAFAMHPAYGHWRTDLAKKLDLEVQ